MTKINKRIRIGDKVVVISGNDKGKAGVVLKRTDKRAVVQGINMKKKHVKPTQERPKGDILTLEMSVHLSNLSVCSADGKPVKLKLKSVDDKRELYYLDNGKEEKYRSVKKN